MKQNFRGLLSRIVDHEDIDYYRDRYGVAVDVNVGINVTCFFWKTGIDVESDGIDIEIGEDSVDIFDVKKSDKEK